MAGVQESLKNFKEHLPEPLSTYQFTVNIIISLVIGVVTILLILYYVLRMKMKMEVPVLSTIAGPPKPRFRKRDKVMFYGRKMLRKVKSFTRNTIRDVSVSSSGRTRSTKKRQLVFKIAKKLLRFKKDQTPQLRRREPAPSFLEVDLQELEPIQHLPPEVMYMLRSVRNHRRSDHVTQLRQSVQILISEEEDVSLYLADSQHRVLGHFEKPIFLELCKYMDSRFIPANQHIFKIGDNDDSIYVVQSGKVDVYISDNDGTPHIIKQVHKGDTIHSLLSVLDLLTGNIAPYKTVEAIAVEDTTILRLPAKAFKHVLDSYPESLVRVVQVIMVRLQRVTFMALHNYLGLSFELMNTENLSDPAYSIHSLHISPKGSPVKMMRDSRLSSIGAEGEKVFRIVNYEDDAGKSTRSMSLNTGLEDKTLSSDFAAACSRARVTTEDTRSVATPSSTITPKGVGDPKSSPPLGFASLRTKSVPSYLKDHHQPQQAASGGSLHATSTEEILQVPDIKSLLTTKSEGQVPNKLPTAAGLAKSCGQSRDDGPMSATGLGNQKDSSSSDLPLSTSTPSFTPSEKSGAQGTPKRSAKRTMISDKVSVIPDPPIEVIDNEEVLKMATKDLLKLLDLQDEALLEGKVFLRHVNAGTELIRQGDQDATLVFVVTGTLQVLQQVVGKEAQECSLFIVHPGELVGSLAVLTGEPSFFTTRARTDSRVVTISKHDFYSIMKEQPTIVLNIAHTVVKRMSPFVRQIDFALDWRPIEAGHAVFRQGEQSDCIYIVLNGRLRSVVAQTDGTKELVGEYGRGELVGIVEVLTQTERATTMMAVRDTEVAVLPEELLNMIKRKFPQVVTRLIHLLGQRILGSLKNRPTIQSPLSEHPNVEPRPAVANLATVAIIPVSDDIPLANFTMELQFATGAIGPALRLTSDTILSKLGNSAFDSVNEYRLLSWLGQQEDIHRMVLYQCDKRMTPWTQHCIRQADCILIVGLSENDPTVGKLEKQMENLAVRAQKELILLHKEDTVTPHGTINWLNARTSVSSHHHIKCPKRVFSRKSYSHMVETYQRLMDNQRPDRLSDFSRLARFLTGTSIGLVLGGGGARGMAHVGMIKALQEAGIPIDMVAGTSIGTLIGGLFCEERNMTTLTQRAREWSMDMNKLWKKILDLTYPVTAMFSGASFNRAIEAAFRNRQIEDLWLPYGAITTDITASKMRVHTSGSLWRYVRASMSLSGYLPPLCDPVDGHLLLDGGYVNNLPADVLKAMGAQTVFAVDVGSQDEQDLTNYGDELSGWWLLWKRWNPWAENVKVPNMAEIQSRLAYVSCVRQLEQVKQASYCEYIRPPIDRYQTLQFGAFDEIHDVGYHHGKTLFSSWVKANLVEEIFKEKSEERIKPTLHQTTVPREADFTDLAELISRIDDPPKDQMFFIASDDEYEDFDDEEDKMSMTSEPAVESMHAVDLIRPRTRSEGASPSTTPTDEVAVDLINRGFSASATNKLTQQVPTVRARKKPLTKNRSREDFKKEQTDDSEYDDILVEEVIEELEDEEAEMSSK